MTRTRLKLLNRFNATLAVAVATFWSAAALAGKPNPGPTLPPIRYSIQFWQAPGAGSGLYINDLNNSGQVVGRYIAADGLMCGFIYDPAVNPNAAIDLNTVADVPDGWRIRSALGINDQGMIVGSLAPSDDSERMGFVLDLATGLVDLLPDQGSAWTYGSRINDSGDVLGLYWRTNGSIGAYVFNLATDSVIDLNVSVNGPDDVCLNNSTALHDTQATLNAAGIGPVRWTRGSGTVTLPGNGTAPHGINDAGTVCGGTYSKNKLIPFRYASSLELFSSYNGAAWDINSSGDLLTSNAVYQDGLGFVSITSLLDASDPDKAAFITYFGNGNSYMNDRVPGVGFGDVVGRIQLPSGLSGFLLTPFPTSP